MKKCRYSGCENEAKNKYCSASCSNKDHAHLSSERMKGRLNPMYGKKPHNYKGGTKTKSGSRKVEYIEVRVDGKRMKSHRHIMEFALGRKLKSNEIVHHIDGNGLNNNISNLQIMSKAEHSRLHASSPKGVDAK